MKATARPAILDRLAALSDELRCRILLLVESRELTVGELCAVLQLPQSTVSRHLKTLHESGWVVSRPDGTRRLYRMVPEPERRDQDRELWRLARKEVSGISLSGQDARRLASVLAERRLRSEEFFAGAAGRWDRLRDELFGPAFHLHALLSWLDEGWTVGDLGCGSGALAEALAPFVRHVLAVDGSASMIENARERLGRFDNVELRRGDLEELPVEDATLDAATLMLVLHHVAEPAAVLLEAARVLAPRGRLLVVDMVPHDRQEYREEMGHVWLGFSEPQIGGWLEEAGFENVRVRPLPPAAAARGPSLFAATASLASAAPSASRDENTKSVFE
jgi:ArsR family transcriptional regulator